MKTSILFPLAFLMLGSVWVGVYRAPQQNLHMTQPPKPLAMCDCGKICNKHFHCGLASCPHGFK